MPYPTKRTRFGDFVFDLNEDVYEPAEDTFLFAENLVVPAGADVLDVGAGCGILGIITAEKARSVVSVDVNPFAIRCAKQNARLNHVQDKMAFIQSDLLSTFTNRAQFDLILFNSPYLPSEEGEADSWIGRSWAGGKTGREVIDRFIKQVPSHLTADGTVLLMQSTLAGAEETIKQFAACGLLAYVKAERKLPFFETLTLIQAGAGT